MTNYEKVKAWRKANPEKVLEQSRRYRERHPETNKKAKEKYIAANIETVRMSSREYRRALRKADPEGQRRRNRAYLERLNAKKEQIAGRPRAVQCELCSEAGRTVFDHCHDSGEFRGWICDRCNKVLGLVYDSKTLLDKMIQYLDKNWRLAYGETHGSDTKCPAVQ